MTALTETDIATRVAATLAAGPVKRECQGESFMAYVVPCDDGEIWVDAMLLAMADDPAALITQEIQAHLQ